MFTLRSTLEHEPTHSDVFCAAPSEGTFEERSGTVVQATDQDFMNQHEPIGLAGTTIGL
jgi:hypothetical protein